MINMDVVASVLTGVFVFMCLYLFWMWFCFGSCVKRRQKTHGPQRRMYAGRTAAQTQPISEPTIYVSPANLPPPPKYELMAPPSYEEVIGIQGPYSASQPITQPIAFAVALQNPNLAPVHLPPNYHNAVQTFADNVITTSHNVTDSDNVTANNATNSNNETVLTVTNERRSSTAAAM